MVSESEDSTETEFSSSRESRIRILLAEDDPSDGRFLATVLAKAGYSVTLECNAHQVIDRVVREPKPDGLYDLVILDLSLHRDDVVTATRQLRSVGCSLPILAITPYRDEAGRHSCLDAGCNAHLAKPLSKEQLLYEVRRLLFDRSWSGMTRAHVHEFDERVAHSLSVSDRNGSGACLSDGTGQAAGCDA